MLCHTFKWDVKERKMKKYKSENVSEAVFFVIHTIKEKAYQKLNLLYKVKR
jgi:hypothetical protein